jgi:3-oxoacyl-[acyl-carrier protein] reductase
VIWVMELWRFRPAVGHDATAAMQEMDDLLGANAHRHPGWCGHARFFSRLDDTGVGMMLYPWRSRELHDDLAASEEPLLQDFYRRWCVAPREIHHYEELAVDIDGDDHEGTSPLAAAVAKGRTGA